MKKTKKALASLAIVGMVLTMVPLNVFASGAATTPFPTRVSGDSAAQTAVAIANQTGWTGKAILASTNGTVDALAAGPLASYLKAPILLTGTGDKLDADTKSALTNLGVKTVYVVSGTYVIHQAVLDEVAQMGINVVPLGGIDRAATSVNIAKQMVGVTKVAVANGIPDALSIAPIAAAANEPILLTDKDSVPASVKAYLAANLSITSSDVIGGTGVISDAVKAQFPGATRHFGVGGTAYDTNNQVIQDFSAAVNYDHVFLANGATRLDALAGAPLAAMTKSAIVLTDGTTVVAAPFVNSKLSANSVVTALGGTAVVPGATLALLTAPASLVVGSVSAINGTEVTLLLTNVPTVLPAASAFTVTDSNSKTYAATSIAATTTSGEYKLTLGTSVSGAGTLTVKYGTSSATKAFDSTTDGFYITISSKDATLTSDGADNTVLTVNAMKDGQPNPTFKGTIKFTSLKGAKFAKDVVAFDKGVATVQLTSISSATAIQDTIIAAVADSEDASAIGTLQQMTIDYVPGGQDGTVADQVFVTYAESDRASDVTVQFNKNFDFTKLYTFWSLNKGTLRVNNNPVQDVVKVNDNTVRLVLDEANRLPDNTKVSVESFYTTTAGAFQDATINFNLVDPTAPAAVGVTTPDYRTVVAQFTEPVATNSATISNWVLNGHRLVTGDVDATKSGIGKASASGAVPVAYVLPTASASAMDNRNFVTIVLTSQGAKALSAAGANNLLQAYNVIDYAGLTDVTGQNMAATQEFRFVTPQPPAAPTATVVAQSPEQYLVTFNTDVDVVGGTDLTAANFKFEYENGLKTDGTPNWTTISLDGSANNGVVTKLSASKYLIELKQDWTKRDLLSTTGNNYYTPNYNQVKVTALKANVENLLGVVMATDQVTTLTNAMDTQEPTIVSAAQTYSATGVAQKSVDVVMSEPVQMNPGTGEITPSQQQDLHDGVPVPTFEFVSADQKVTLDGELGTIAPDDMSFSVVPVDPAKLTAGTWTLIIRSISDDVGNTSATKTATITIAGGSVAAGTPRIIWAVAENNVDLNQNAVADEDVVHIQFGTIMSLDALTSGVYTINSKAIPAGSSITSFNNSYLDANGNTLVGTLVTIELPKDFLGTTDGVVVDTFWGTPAAATGNMLNVSKSLTDAKGNALLTPTEVPLTYNYYAAPGTQVNVNTLFNAYLSSSNVGYTLYSDVVLANGLTLGVDKTVNLNGHKVTISGVIATGGNTITSTGTGTVEFENGFSITGAVVGHSIIVNTNSAASYELGTGATIPAGYSWTLSGSNAVFSLHALT